nr:MAG TPA: hypothetical protein [Caudoviricetes sp.]DAG72251.1 MAG TPA: hypothetical protein [Caudoviricetes sp.]
MAAVDAKIKPDGSYGTIGLLCWRPCRQLAKSRAVCDAFLNLLQWKIPRSFHETTRDFLGGVGGI